MGILNTFVNRPVTTVMLVLVFVVLGLVSYDRMIVDLFPELEFPLVQIIMVYPGAGPQEIESQIVKKIEDEISNISDIKTINSMVHEGFAWTIIEFELGVDVDIKALDIKDKVELIKQDLPDAAEDPVIAKFDPLSTPVMQLALLSSTMSTRDLYELADKQLKNYFGQVSGVAKIEIIGGEKRQINLWAKLDKLAQYGLTVPSLLEILGRENIDIPAGNIRQTTREIGIRFKGEARSVEDIARLQFNAPGHGIITLADVARIEDGSEQVRSLVRFEEQNAVLLKVYKRADGNTIQVADKTYDRLAELQAGKILPEGTTITIASDDSTYIRDSVKSARDNIIMGILLCAGLLFLFLRDIRITIVAAIVLPTSIVSAFLFMDFFGFTLNILTLLALGISIGALVANAIVVLENIARYVELGRHPRDAAIIGTKEIAVAVMASAGTNIVVFTPIAFMGGIIGQFFFQFGLTIVFATLFSLFASFSLTPMLSSIFIRAASDRKERSAFRKMMGFPLDLFNQGIIALQNFYAYYLGSVLRHPYLVILLTIVSFLGVAQLMQFIGGEFFPRADQSVVNIVAQMPKGATEQGARSLIGDIEQIILREVPERQSYTAIAGGENVGFDEVSATIRLKKPEERTRSDQDIIYAIQASLSKVSGGEIIVLGEAGGGSRADLDVDLYGPDYNRLAELSHEIRQHIMNTGNFRAVFNKYRDPKDEMHFIPDAYRRSDFFVPNALIGTVLRYSIEGEKGSVLRVDGEEYEIKVRLDEQYRDSLSDLLSYDVPGHTGLIPLNMLGNFVMTKGVSDLNRKNKQRVITLECFIAEKTLTENMALLAKEFEKIDFPPGYSYEFAGQAEMQQESSKNILIAFILAIILTYMLLAAILDSFFHPLTIMITIPLGLIGVILTLFFTGISMNIMSMMAIVMLVGIVVNNAILIIDYALQKSTSCDDTMQNCMHDACIVKFRAILMTNLAIMAGIFPQILGGSGTEFMMPMAAATMGGVAVSTVFTLFTIPALFMIIERILSIVLKAWR